jgi:hypothetical protein
MMGALESSRCGEQKDVTGLQFEVVGGGRGEERVRSRRCELGVNEQVVGAIHIGLDIASTYYHGRTNVPRNKAQLSQAPTCHVTKLP